MTKKAIISIDLASVYGSLQLKIPPRSLPRHNKAELELAVAGGLLRTIQSRSSHSFVGLRICTQDPPDALFEHNGVTTGIELTELLPPNRLGKDAIIRSLRKNILSGLNVGLRTRNHVVNIFFKDDYSEQFRPKNCVAPLVRLLNDFFESSGMNRSSLPVPLELEGVVSRINVDSEDLSGDVRLANKDHPLILFGAQNTQIIPDDDISVMFDATFGRKLLHDLSVPTWLLVWSHHPAIDAIRDEVVSYLRIYLSRKRIKYQHVFYLGLEPPGIIAHIPVIKEDRPLFDEAET